MQVEKMEFDERPWGNYLVLEENPHYISKIFLLLNSSFTEHY